MLWSSAHKHLLEQSEDAAKICERKKSYAST